MLWIDALVALFVALLIAWALVGLFGWRRPGLEVGASQFLFLFLVLLGLIWAGGAWLRPIGPPAWGTFWLSFVIVGFFLALLLLAVAPPPPRTPARRPEETPGGEPAPAAADPLARSSGLDVFFGMLLLGAVLALILAYLL